MLAGDGAFADAARLRHVDASARRGPAGASAALDSGRLQGGRHAGGQTLSVQLQHAIGSFTAGKMYRVTLSGKATGASRERPVSLHDAANDTLLGWQPDARHRLADLQQP